MVGRLASWLVGVRGCWKTECEPVKFDVRMFGDCVEELPFSTPSSESIEKSGVPLPIRDWNLSPAVFYEC